ncbi:MAG: type IV pilus twitching motility protein PilT [Candidatus Brocadiia bacterium]|jgi:twitching motility protein PilT
MIATQNAEEQATIRIEDLMRDAVGKKASDIHLVAGQAPIMRIHGDMVAVEGLPPMSPAQTSAAGQELTSKAQWEQFVAERDLDFSVSRPGLARFRANLYWQRDSVAIALRLIPEHIATFAELGLPKQLEKFAMMEHGLFLVTGPTGSGKSTTLAAMLDWINERRSCNIITIEDPIEFLHKHKRALISQREMNQDTRSFAQALRRVLRQDPDVILVGELRDLETIQMAMTLAETGHLVLSTLHTTDAIQTANRIIDSYPPQQQLLARSQLSFVLAGIMAQGLMRRRDQPGRVMAMELLVATPAVRNLIRTGEIQQLYAAMEGGNAEGMTTLNASLLYLYRQGQISREDAIQQSTQPKELIQRLYAR